MSSSQTVCQACGAELPSRRPEGLCPACLLQLALEPEPELPEGREVSHYTLLERLGRGGMGEVYKARDRRLDRLVAIKFLPEDLAEHPEALGRFEREARTASSLNHPHICTLYDVGDDDGRPFIVMELVEGETLEERLSRGPLSLEETLRLGIQIGDALEAAHSNGIIHRDIKPSNIIINQRGDAKILDFGLARYLEPLADGFSSSLRTQTGSILGTIPYMSPEQLAGQEVDHRTDLFSLGAVIYKTVTGRHPFKRPTAVATMKAICEDPPPPLTNYCDCPSLERLVQRLLAKAPDRRPSSAGEVARLLALIETERMPKRGLAGRRPALAGMTLAAVFSFSFLLIYFQGLPFKEWFDPSPRIRSVAVLPFVNLSQPDQEWLAAGMTDATIARLTEIEGLRVPSRTTIMQYKDSRKSLSQIARELKADAIVEASVQLTDTEVHCRVRVIEAGRERTLVGPLEFRRGLQDIAELQNSIALAVANEILWKLSPETERHLVETVAVDYEAQLSNMRGRYLLEKRHQEALEKAVDHLQAAIERQPDYAEAHAGLATAYTLLGSTGYSTLPPALVMPKAREAARRALELNEELAEAHAVLGNVAMSYDWDWKAAERHLKRALELDPDFAPGRHWYGLYLAAQGRLDQALEEVEKAVAIDPLSPVNNSALARVYYYMRDYERARREYLKTLDLEPEFTPAHLGLGLVALKQGSFPEAIAEFQLGLKRPLAPFLMAFERAGSATAMSELREIQELAAGADDGSVSPFQLAVFFAILGRINSVFFEEVFTALDVACEIRSEYLVYIRVDPVFDDLREDPRYAQLLRRIGLEPSG